MTILLNKKLFILIPYLKNKILLNPTLFVYILLTRQLILIYIVLNNLCLIVKTKIKLLYHYYIKVKVPNWMIFNSILLFLFYALASLKLHTKLKFKYIKQNSNYTTFIRSPFKYKSSKESFEYQVYGGTLNIELNNIDYFIIDYWDFFLIKIFNYWIKSDAMIKCSKYNIN